MTAFTFAPAVKQQLKARIALEGVAGSGKTWTALTIAEALGGRIAVVDTEHRSALLYADQFKFDWAGVDSFAPEVLIDALAAAAEHNVCIVDSFSHWWMGIDGMLEQVDRAGKRSGGGNNFAGWKDMRPVERRMIDALLSFPGHLIVTMRVKSEYVVEDNEKGRKAPRKVGTKAEQRDNLDYEFDFVATLDNENTMVVTKSRCSALSGAVISKPDGQVGHTLLDWLNSGDVPVTAAELFAEAEKDGMGVDELRDLFDRAKAADRLASVIRTESGTATLGEHIRALGAVARDRAKAAAEAAKAEEPAEETPAVPMIATGHYARMTPLWKQLDLDGDAKRDDRLAVMEKVLNRLVTTSKELTAQDADKVIDALKAKIRWNKEHPPVPAEPETVGASA